MTSSHHARYTLGDTRATMVGTKGCDPAKVNKLKKFVLNEIVSRFVTDFSDAL